MAGRRPGRDAQLVDRGTVLRAPTQKVARAHKNWDKKDMDALNNIRLGMTAEQTVIVTSGMTVGHFVANMPRVYATPMMILHMEMASGSAIAAHLPKGFISVGMGVKVRHLTATPVGRKVRTISRVIQIDSKSVMFEVEAWDGDRKIGDGTHRRGIVNVLEFEKRFGVRQLSRSMD